MSQVIATIDRSTFQTTIKAQHHQVLADEPIPIGTDLGPTPYDYLLAALGSCVAITLRMYADRKKWPLEEVEVQLSQQRIHAEDCEHCESEEGYVHVIEKKLVFKGDLTDEQRKRLLEISDKCPVNKTLTHEIVIKTGMVEG